MKFPRNQETVDRSGAEQTRPQWLGSPALTALSCEGYYHTLITDTKKNVKEKPHCTKEILKA